LAASVPRSEADAFAQKANRLEAALTETREKLGSAEARMRDLESRLAESIPKAEAESSMQELQGKLSESKTEADTLRERVSRLESRVAVAERELEGARSRIKELEVAAARPPAEERTSDLS